VPFDVSFTVATAGVITIVNPTSSDEMLHGILRFTPA
jgi:hypothetical protein